NAEQKIFLSEDGFRTESEIENTDVKWSAFTKSVIFDDGVLLYRGTNVVNWIPDTTLDGDNGAARLRKLVSAKLPTNQAVNRYRRQRIF
ncbi:YcxB family protein, partial [Rhodopirellula sallentina]